MNILENKRLIVRHVFKESTKNLDKRHLLYGGMLDGTSKIYSLPKHSSGGYVKVLTEEEEECLEDTMGLSKGTLSIYKKVDNFWDNFKVKLSKEDTYLRLNKPEDYIRYKVLLANENFVCPSMDELERFPKATYEYVIVDENKVASANRRKFNNTTEAYMKLGKIENDACKLRVILEILEKRPVSKTTSTDMLLTKINEYVVANPSKFLNVINDEYLNTKVLLTKAVDLHLVKDRGGLLYMADDGTPLCEEGNPTMDVAAKFLNMPRHSDIKYKLEGYINSPSVLNTEATPVPESKQTSNRKKAQQQ